MKGIILAGGTATRLRPLTLVTNKHLLPVYNKPMIYYPLEAMKKAGVDDVLIITGPPHVGSFMNLLKSGQEFGLKLTYEIQQEAGGISQGIALGESFADGKKVLVLLGDGIFSMSLKKIAAEFEKQEKGARIFAMEMENAKQYGVIETDKSGNVLSIEEKPENPKSNLAQTGIYMYDERVFSFIKNLTPSKRGELEVTDLNSIYVKEKTIKCELMDWWIDAGTSVDELLRANNMVFEKVKTGELK